MSEHQHQVALFNWARMHEKAYPELRLMYAIPNAAKRSKRQGAYMKAEGLKAGVPDVCLPVARHGFNALYIELKAQQGRMQKNQIEWQQALNRAGNFAVTCVGWAQAKECIENYLGGKQ